MNSKNMIATKRTLLKKRHSAPSTEPKEKFPINIPESQGDLADQAENQIEADLQEEIERARHGKKAARSSL